MRATSEGEARGATFSVRLPLGVEAKTGQAGTVPASSALKSAPPLDGLRVLVVDDNADGRTLTSLILTQSGASVHVAATVRDARRAIEVQRPDVLVSDIGLPDEDGYALIRHVRQYEAEHGGFMPAVALTGFARAEDRARTLAAGFQAYVPKPVDPVELTAAVASITQALRSGTS